MPRQKKITGNSQVNFESVQLSSTGTQSPTNDTSIQPSNIYSDSTTWKAETDETITAPVILPPREDMAVKLVPINLKERLDEYQSDENIAYALIGLFAGAALGIIGDWAVNDFSIISWISVVLVVNLILFTTGSFWWLFRSRKRKMNVIDKANKKTINN